MKVLTVRLARRSRHQDSGVTAILQWQFGSSWDVSGGAHNEVFVKSEATCLQSCGAQGPLCGTTLNFFKHK